MGDILFAGLADCDHCIFMYFSVHYVSFDDAVNSSDLGRARETRQNSRSSGRCLNTGPPEC